MPTIAVNSSMCSELGYNEQTQTLTVVFLSGDVYEYSGVSKMVWSALQVAPSVGQYLRAYVIGRYPESKV